MKKKTKQIIANTWTAFILTVIVVFPVAAFVFSPEARLPIIGLVAIVAFFVLSMWSLKNASILGLGD